MIDDTNIQEETLEQAPAEETQDNPEKQPQTAENTPVKQPQMAENASDKERNLAALRMAKEQAQRERDEMAMRLRDIEEKLKPKTNEQEEDYSLGIGESDLAEGKHLTKMQKQHVKEQKALREEMAKTQKQLQAMIIETRIKAECPDIDKVVTEENMSMLATLHPEIAETIKSSNNYYSQAKTAYKLMKQFGIYKEDTYGQDRERAQANAKSPKPLASISPQTAETPLSHANAFANGLTEELKAQLRKEMEEAIKNY